MPKLVPVTRSQEYQAAILDELTQIKGLLQRLAIDEGIIDGVECPVCHRKFGTPNALRAHSRVHKKKEAK